MDMGGRDGPGRRPCRIGAVAWRAVTTEHADPVDAQNRFAAALAASSSKTPLIKRDSSGHWARPEGTLSRGSQPTHLEVLAYRASEERMIKADVPLWFLKIKGLPSTTHWTGPALTWRRRG